MGLLGSVSASTAASDFVLLALFGALGYFYAQRMRRAIGTTPWRLPPAVWAVISALLPIYGFLLEMLAGVTTRARGRLGGLGHRPPYEAGRDGASYQVPPSPFPGAGPANPAGGSETWPSAHSVRPGPGGWLPSPGGEPPPLFGWYPDPEGAHEERYWDGRFWSDTVRDGGVVSLSPLGPARPPWQPAGSSEPVGSAQ